MINLHGELVRVLGRLKCHCLESVDREAGLWQLVDVKNTEIQNGPLSIRLLTAIFHRDKLRFVYVTFGGPFTLSPI